MGKFTAFKLNLKSLPAGSHHFDYHLDKTFFTNMENADVRDADVEVALDVVYRGDTYDLSFHLTGTLTLICDRCLDDLPFDIDTTYHVLVKYGDDYDESDELLIIPQSDTYLNVAYMIHDTAALTIPIRHVHPMGKCNRAMSAMLRKHNARVSDEDAELEDRLIDEMESGQCDAVSDDAPSDPRWDALRGLASEE